MTLRIIHLSNHCDLANGNVHVAVDLACAQSAEGAHVIFASKGGHFEELLRAHGVQHLTLPHTIRRPTTATIAFFNLAKLCRDFKPDIIHAHMMSGALLGKAASLLYEIPVVNTVHNSFDRHSRIMHIGDAVVAVSKSEFVALEKMVAQTKLRVVVNGPIGSPRYQFRAQPAQPGRKKIIACLSGLHRRKGVQELIIAFAMIAEQFPDWHLAVYGEGPDAAALMAMTQDRGLAHRVHFNGKVDQPIEALSGCEIFVTASHVEPLGLSVIEARMAGCAIIGTEVGGIPEVLNSGRSGILVPPRDPNKLAAALKSLMGNELYRKSMQLSTAEGLEKFHMSAMAKGYSEVYRNLIESKARRRARTGQ